MKNQGSTTSAGMAGHTRREVSANEVNGTLPPQWPRGEDELPPGGFRGEEELPPGSFRSSNKT
jgi:hypothetical protein